MEPKEFDRTQRLRDAIKTYVVDRIPAMQHAIDDAPFDEGMFVIEKHEVHYIERETAARLVDEIEDEADGDEDEEKIKWLRAAEATVREKLGHHDTCLFCLLNVPDVLGHSLTLGVAFNDDDSILHVHTCRPDTQE